MKESTRSAEELGQILSRLHWQCWREDAPLLGVGPSELVAVLPILIRSGSVGLVWPRLRGQLDRYGAIALALEDAYQAQVAHNARVERDIARVVTRLQDHGIDPILVKGWSVARQYPEGLVRPAGDIDLVVREEEFERATVLISELDREAATIGVDLKHPGIWKERPADDPRHETHKVTACRYGC